MSLRPYPAYKPSGVEWLGDVPGHWSVRRSKFIFEIKKRIAGEEGYDVLSITQQGIKVKDVESNDGQLSMDYSKYQLVHVGDYAMNHMDLLTGYVDISSYFGVTSPDYRVFSLLDNVTQDARFFLYLLQNGYRQKIFYAFGQGSSQLGRWRFPAEQFNDFVFPLPPKEEQVAIVSFLDREIAKLDVLVIEQERLLTLVAEKRQATISRAITNGLSPGVAMKDSGIAWLGDVPRHWNVIKLRHATRQIVDGAHFTPTYVSEGVPFLRVTDITSSTIDLDEVKRIPQGEHEALIARCKPQKGDLLLSKNGTIGVPRVVTWDWDFSIFVSLCLIKLKSELSAEFLCYVFQSSAISIQINESAKQSTVTNLHLEKISGFRFPLPPLKEQRAIVANLDSEVCKFDALRAEAQRAIDLLKERRSALIAAAVTGKVDVRGAGRH